MIEIKVTGENAADVLTQLAGLIEHTACEAEPSGEAAAPAPTQAAGGTPVSTPVPIPAVPTSPAPGITLEQIGRAGADLITADPGKMPQLMELLQQYGAPSIQHLRPDQIGAFATALRGLGAKI